MNYKFSLRSGASFARGTTIDPLLSSPEDVKVLYEKWKDAWGEPLQFQGGEKAITCDMVTAAPLKELVKTYGKARVERYLSVAREFSEV